MIFKPDFKEAKDYVLYLNNKCIEIGFNGIYLIESREDVKDNVQDNVFLREPTTSLNYYRKSPSRIVMRSLNKFKKNMRRFGFRYVEKFDGDNIMRYSIKHRIKDKQIFSGLCFEWDNTPRHGYRGYIITPPKKETFMMYMDSLKDSDYLFINAWNEWCEGMILEPTVENGYKYLEWIKEWSEK